MVATAELWPDLEYERAAATMRTALWQLRRFEIGVDGRTQQLQLHARSDVDLWCAVHRARRLQDARCGERTGQDSAESPWEESWSNWIPHFTDDLLPDWPDEWLVLHRERHRQMRLHALEHLCRGLLALGRTASAIEAAVVAVAADPLRESAQRVLIEAHLEEGNLSEAVRQFRSYADLLMGQLGVAPSHDLASLLPSLNRRSGPPKAGRDTGHTGGVR